MLSVPLFIPGFDVTGNFLLPDLADRHSKYPCESLDKKTCPDHGLDRRPRTKILGRTLAVLSHVYRLVFMEAIAIVVEH